MLQILQNQKRCALAHDETVSFFIERSRTSVRIGTLRKRRHICETGERNVGERRFRTAGNHRVVSAALNIAESFADSMRSRGAGGGNSHGNTLCPRLNGDVSGDHIGNRHRHHKRRYSGNSPFNRLFCLSLQCHDSADPRTSDHSESVRIHIFSRLKAAVLHRFSHSYDSILRGEVQPLRGSFIRKYEILDLCAHAGLMSRRIEMSDLADTVFFMTDTVPEIITVVSHRTYDAHSGDYYPFFCHFCLYLLNRICSLPVV